MVTQITAPTIEPAQTTPKPTIKVTEAIKIEVTPTIIQPLPSPTSKPTIELKSPTPIPTIAPQPTLNLAKGAQSILQRFQFDYLPPFKTPVIKVFATGGRLRIRLSKIDSKLYNLLVESCTISGNHLTLPHFPSAVS